MRQWTAVSLAALMVACQAEDTAPRQSFNDVFLALDSVPAPADSIGDPSSFGYIDDAVVLRDGGVVVVDGMNGLVRLLRAGAEVHRIGGLGDGPREFRCVRRAAYLGGDSILVLDQCRGRIVLLQARQDSLIWAHDALAAPWAEDLCVVGGRLYLAGTYDGRIIHRATLSGEVTASFGELEGMDPLSQALSGTGVLACSEERERLAFASLTLGIVRVFSADGQELRRDSIPGFVRTVYEVTGVRMRPTLPEQGYAHAVTAMTWMGDELLVQLTRGPRSDGVGRESRMWRADGTWVRKLPEWPRLLDMQADSSLLTVADDPYPRLLIYRVR